MSVPSKPIYLTLTLPKMMTLEQILYFHKMYPLIQDLAVKNLFRAR